MVIWYQGSTRVHSKQAREIGLYVVNVARDSIFSHGVHRGKFYSRDQVHEVIEHLPLMAPFSFLAPQTTEGESQVDGTKTAPLVRCELSLPGFSGISRSSSYPRR